MRSLSPRLPMGLLVVTVMTVLSLLVLSQTPVRAAAFAQGNIVVYRVGDGGTITGSNAAAVFLDEYTVAGGTPVQSLALPTTDNGANKQLVAQRDASDEGLLTRSADGQYLLLTGYDTDLGTASPSTVSPESIPRVIGRVDSAGAIDTSTLLSDGDSQTGVTGSPRSAASTNGTDLFFGGNRGGVRYTTLGSTAASTAVTTPPGQSIRQLNIFDGQLYATTNTDPVAIGSVGSGTPTTGGQTITALPGITSGASGTTDEAYGFFFADLDGTAGLDTLYIADDGNDAIQKFSLVGGTWVLNGSIALTDPIPTSPSVRGLIGTVAGTSVTLYGTTTTRLYSVTDATGFNQAPAVTTISILATNTVSNSAFRGLAFAPVGVPVPTATPTDTPTATATATATATTTATATATTTATATATTTATATATTTATTTATAIPSTPSRILLPLVQR